MAQAARKGNQGDDAGTARINMNLLQAAYAGDLDGVQSAIAQGADADSVHEQTGLTALHIAVGTNNLAMTRYLIEDAGARIGPDRSGRWPTVIAAECRTSDELCDYIVEAEAKEASR
ncbi:MAG: ankyrin repeat domain-containing protein [Rhizobiales bacterium]|nr:ankyrin repeat domain-containing protein [Hyphomicrobiales bacterium]MBN9489965.1 ankyrin repeat domain-containing protein [Alphaproteobacteria bacterium]